MSNLNARRWVKQCVAAVTSRPTARQARPVLSVHRLEDRWVPTSLPPGNYTGNPFTGGTAFEFDQAGTYAITGNLSIPPGVTLTVGKAGVGVNLIIRDEVTVTVGGTLAVASPAKFEAEDFFGGSAGIQVAAGGRLTLADAVLGTVSTAGNSNTTFVRVASGGRLAAANSTLGWDEVKLANGSLLDPGAATRNAFDTALYTPADYLPRLADNLRFRDVNLNPGSVTLPALDLVPLGTATTADQRYVFPESLTVPAGATVSVGAKAVVLLRDEVTVTVGGTLAVASPAKFEAEDFFGGSAGIQVAAGGRLTLADAVLGTVSTAGNSNTTFVRVASGGRFGMSGGSHGWDLLDLQAGSSGTVQYISIGNKSAVSIHSSATAGITNNDFSGASTKSIVGVGTPSATIPFGGNFWGTTLPAAIGDLILDRLDDTARPLIDFNAPLAARPVRAVVAAPAAVTYSGAAQPVTLTAAFASPSGLVGDGTATFTVLSGAGATVGTATAAVAGGAATAAVTLPAGTAAGVYTVRVGYGGSATYGPAQGDSTLTVNKAATDGALGGLGPVTYTLGSQQITVSASVTSPAGTVGVGTVVVSVRNGSNAAVGGGSLTVGPDGKASGPITLNAGTPVGDYTVSAGYPGSANFAASTFADQPLTVTKATATVSATAAAVAYKAAGRTVPLTALVLSGAGAVGEGQVTFTLYDASNTTPVGASKAVAVSNGTAAVDYPLAAGSPVGGYVVRVSYAGAANFVDAGGTGPLTVTKATPTVTVGAVGKTVSAAAQVVRLTAAVADPPEAVGEGAVTFTVLDAGGRPLGGTAGPAAVAAGQAAADYTLPAGTPAGVYRVRAVFAGASNYQDRTAEAPAGLTVTRNPTAVAVAPVGAVTYSSGPQTVTVSVGVTSGRSAVGEGQVRFTLQGLAGVAAQTVGVGGDGRAAATFTLPAGATAGSYPVQAEYLGTATFDGAGDASRSLAVNPAAVTLAVADAAAAFAAAGSTVTLRADLTSAAGPVAGGTVTFTVLDGGSPVGSPATAGVAAGTAAAVYTLPAGTPGGSYTVRVAYSGATNFAPAGPADRPALAVTPAAVAGTLGGADAVAYSGAGQPLAVRAELTGGGGPVAGGTVTFAAFDGAVQVGDTKTAAVVNGVAAATLQLPPGTPAGAYTVRATFGGTPSVAAGPLAERPLTVTPAGVTVSVPGVSAGFDPTAETSVLLTAALASPAGAVVGGAVTFTVLDGPTPVGEPRTAAVEGGTASASYALPAGTRAGRLAVRASYSGAANFAAGSADVPAAVTVDKAAVGVAVRAAAADYRVGGGPVALAADLTSPAGVVGGGTAAFTVLRGGAVVAAATAAVADGVAAAVVTLPPDTPAGDLTVRVGYDGTADLAAATAGGTLTVRPAATALAVAAATTRVRPAGQAVQLTAAVTSPAGVVGAGTVTFTVFRGPTPVGSPATVPVAGGVATAGYPLPPGGGAGDLVVRAVYNATADLTGAGATGTLTLTRSPAGLIGDPQFAAGSGGPGGVRSFNPDASPRATLDPFPGFSGGVRTAAADFTGDGVAEVVAGTGPGRATRVVVLDGATGAELFAVDPFEAGFTGGVFVAAGDLTGDGVPELVITPDEGGGPRVRVFDGAGFGQLADFFGIDDPNFRGGARAAVGDVTGDGVGELVVAAGFGGGPRVAVFDGTSLAGGAYTRRPVGDFFAFEQTLRNGVYVAAGDLDGDGKAEVIAGGGPGGGPRVTAFAGADLLAGGRRAVADFFAGDDRDRDGVRLAVKDLDGDARADLVAGPGRGTRVRAYAGAALAAGGTPAELFALDAFDGRGGVFVG